jgi:2-dehydro-3-deoxyphosphogluconate aldolase/(4S)-4-hydroxy-2-oxoglutarate aldolase
MSSLSTIKHSREAKRQFLLNAKLIPVLRYHDTEEAAYAAEVAIEAGCTTLELTWTIPNVIELIKSLRAKHGERLLLGLGTVLTASQAWEALDKARVDFLVSPGLMPDIVEHAHAASALCILGAFTPTEVMQARYLKADIVKIFPAETGGPKHLAGLKAVFPDMLFCPTGGVTAQNMHDYMKAGAAMVGLGKNLYDQAAFAARNTPALVKVIKRTREALDA